MDKQFERTIRLVGEDAQKKLLASRVIVFGIGGVGSFAAEALARAGVGHLAFVDADVVDITNINRQLVATHETVGRAKCDVMRERALSINPQAEVEAIRRMRYRMEQGARTSNLKRGPGGVVDIEFIVQVLQLVHGGDDPRLRTTETLHGLSLLRAAGVPILAGAAA